LISAASRAILPGLVRRLLLSAALAALAGACYAPCEDLGDRICGCQPAGAFRDACERAVEAEVSAASPTRDEGSFCNAMLKTCPNPETDSGACEKMKTEAGKVACGLAYECVDDANCAAGKVCTAGRCLTPPP
jgi:hypothetical protein